MTDTISAIGLTWDHPRGYNALAAASSMALDSSGNQFLRWEKQPLEGFESARIGQLAARFDLLVLDHPHIGEAVALECLTPLEEIFSAAQLANWSFHTIGAAMQSYHWGGKQWALPLDVATQVMARRSDIVNEAPDNWEDVLRLSETGCVALSIAGVHAILNVYALAASLGAPLGGQVLIDDQSFSEALQMLKRLHDNIPPGSGLLNPIALYDHMIANDDIALVPLIYGYVNYADVRLAHGGLVFSDAPLVAGGAVRGSVLGGTGLAFSTRSPRSRELIDHIAWLMSAKAQECFIPGHDGQPSRRSVYGNNKINAAYGNFYANTLLTCQSALIRPRYDGYVRFQTGAARTVRGFLSGAGSLEQTIDTIRADWRASLAGARGPVQSHLHPVKENGS
ncbi:MAG: carbohydrate ABC transporter substrate-binding protein [Alphaproteobacteria bacterium]|nr:carbohydrate ABC transporter substrate-binding protein [Alphaproteobacteria bacterium]